MLNNKFSRRSVVKSAAATAVVVSVAASLPASATSISSTKLANATAGAMTNTEQYIYNVLIKNFKNSKVVGAEDIKQFTLEFVRAHPGGLNLKADYSGIAGEYELVKAFIKTV